MSYPNRHQRERWAPGQNEQNGPKQTPNKPGAQQEAPRFSTWIPEADEPKQHTRHWQPPRVGDIVETRFPDFLKDGFGIKSVVKTRPCMVVGVEEFANGQTVVKVAYGTSHLEERIVRGKSFEGIQPGELFVPASDARTGLTQDTKFCLRQVLELPFSTEYFKPCPDQRYGVYPKRGKVDMSDPTYRRAIDIAIREAREHGSLLERDAHGWHLKTDTRRNSFKR